MSYWDYPIITLSFSPNSSETNLKILTAFVKQCSRSSPPCKRDVTAALVRIGKTTLWVTLWVLWLSSSMGNYICQCNTHFQFLLGLFFPSSIFYCFTIEGMKCWGRYRGRYLHSDKRIGQFLSFGKYFRIPCLPFFSMYIFRSLTFTENSPWFCYS